MKTSSRPSARPSAKPRQWSPASIRKTVLCVIVFLVLCIPIPFVNTAEGYVPALSFLVILAVSYGYLRLCERNLFFAEKLSSLTCARGGAVTLTLRLRNSSLLFIPCLDVCFSISNLFGNEAVSHTQKLCMDPRSTEDFSFRMDFAHLGTYKLGLEKIVIFDPLRLFSRTIQADRINEVTVLPRLREVTSLPFSDVSTSSPTEALKISSGEGDDYTGVREYTPGDPMKLIHWKLSSHYPSLLTKLFENHSEPKFDVMLDLFSPAYDDEQLMDVMDIAVEAALSIALFAHDRGLDARILFLDENGEARHLEVSGNVNLPAFMGRVPRVSTNGGESFDGFVKQHTSSLYGAENLAVLSARSDASLLESVTSARANNRKPLFFALMPQGLDSAEQRRRTSGLLSLERAGIPFFALTADREVLP